MKEQKNSKVSRIETPFGFREGNPWEMTEYLDKEWDKQVHIEIALFGQELVVPNGWHGAGKRGDAMVVFGDVLTKPFEETYLSSHACVDWLSQKGFFFENTGPLTTEAAAELLISKETHDNGVPIFRAVRGKKYGVPIVIEYYHGSQSSEMQDLAKIGNMDEKVRTEKEKEKYRNTVTSLMMPFVSHGATKAKNRMGLSDECYKIRRIDDCAAALTTIAADMIVDDYYGMPKPDFDEIGVAVATTQAMVVAIFLAEKRHVPLFVRAGAPSFGLFGEKQGLNYMANTQKQMLALGAFTSGDFGEIMKRGFEQYEEPHIRLYGSADTKNITRFYFNGGGPIQIIMREQYRMREKPHHGIVHVIRASRIDRGAGMWGVIFSGKHLGCKDVIAQM